MTLKLELSSEVEKQLHERAASSGQPVEAIVLEAVTEKLAAENAESHASDHNGQHWKAKLRECIELHPNVTHVVDDSRQSIYSGRVE